MSSSMFFPVPKAHLALLACLLLPVVLNVPYNVSIAAHAALTVYVGCWRSRKPAGAPLPETMTNNDAVRFPLVGSAVLLGLFLMFKFFPKELVNALLALYMSGLGMVVLIGTIAPFARPLFPEQLQDKQVRLPSIPRLPMLTAEPINLEASVPELVLAVPCLGICCWYYITKSWLANNILGVGFSISGIEHLSIGSTKTAGILLVGLFFYDIFWVFCTPVMVSVAKNFDAPIKLLFPRIGDAVRNFAMLGLGDIVIPGLWVALMLRYDASRNHKTCYFQSSFWGYVGGLLTTIFIMDYFKAAQPALLYIVPAVLGAVAVHSAWAGELNSILEFSEASAPDGPSKSDKGKAH